jgi:hypothetical protein
MLRRVFSSSSSSAIAPASSALLLAAQRSYRVMPHLDNEVEELAETQKKGRWFMSYKPNYAEPPKQSENMCDRLNQREKRRNGNLPEKSIARRMSNIFAKDGKMQKPYDKVKTIIITVIGFDGHPYHHRVVPMPDTTLNLLIDGSGMNHGWPQQWARCKNPDCSELNHSDGCLINVDLETLERLPPPGRFEYFALTHWRNLNRPDFNYTARFSCQIKLDAELDGGVFALKQWFSRSLRESVADWGEDDAFATIACHRQRKIEPWAPPLEEPTVRDFPMSAEMLFVKDYEEVMKYKYPNYRRKDGFNSRPEYWSSYC